MRQIITSGLQISGVILLMDYLRQNDTGILEAALQAALEKSDFNESLSICGALELLVSTSNNIYIWHN